MRESEDYVQTKYGYVWVNVYGDKKKTPIVTFHDIGLNARDNFHDYFDGETGDVFLTGFCIYNINAPGQTLGADEFMPEYQFPSMENLVELINEVAKVYKLKEFIGLGIGAGANLMLRYAIKYPNKMLSLILINCVETKVGWMEWAQEKLNIELLRDFGMTRFTENYLLWHHLGQCLWKCPKEEVENFKAYYEQRPNPKNVAAFIESYLKRDEIDFHKDVKPFTIPVLQIIGERSAFVQDAEYLHSILDPKYSELVKLLDCGGNVLDEKPAKATEAILYHLQGLGFVPWLDVHDVYTTLEKFEQPFEKVDPKDDQADQNPPLGDDFIENLLSY